MKANLNSLNQPNPTLYICATPIGHLSDCSIRLLDTLHDATCIAAEDTRVTKKLCEHYGIKTPLIPVQKHNEKEMIHTQFTTTRMTT